MADMIDSYELQINVNDREVVASLDKIDATAAGISKKKYSVQFDEKKLSDMKTSLHLVEQASAALDKMLGKIETRRYFKTITIDGQKVKQQMLDVTKTFEDGIGRIRKETETFANGKSVNKVTQYTRSFKDLEAAIEKEAQKEAKLSEQVAKKREEAAQKAAEAERKAIEDGLKAWEQYEKEQERLAEQEYDRYLKEQQAAEKAAEAKVQADSKVAMAAQLRSDKEVEEAQRAAQERERAIQEAINLYDQEQARIEHVNTAMQNQIEAVVGIGNATKSAQASASVFEQAIAEVQQSLDGLISKYSTLSMHIDNLRGRYPEGTFDEVSEAVQRNRDALQRLNDQYAAGEISEEQLAAETSRLSTEYGRLKSEVDSTASSTGKLEKQSASLWKQLTAGVTVANIIRRALRLVISEVKEALSTMKDVDTELTKIRKVTNQSPEEIEAIGDRAYATASKYGVAANEYLSAAADFAKAGYSNYDTMAELATKTQLVGDVTADVASRFLLSADAAWKFNGNIESLSTVLDKANTIENNYATSLEKLADGFPIVASTAAMANMSIDETMAALGTITSVTQESGRKAATALRALILNITGEVGAEVEEGVEITKEEVESLGELLNKYASEAVDNAKKMGKVLDPMEAIGALAKAYQEGILTEAEITNKAIELGGKLRTNQLISLIKNWGTFEEMLEKVRESAGSANEEILVMSESWERKSIALKNSWTELVNTLVDTNVIKNALDDLTLFIQGQTTIVDELQKWFSGYYRTDEGKAEKEKINEYAADFFSTGKYSYSEAVTLATRKYREERDAISEATEATEQNTNAVNDNEDAIGGLAGTEEEAEKATVTYARSVNALYDALNGARDAKTAFDTAMEAEEKDDVFKGYAEAFAKLQEEIDAGRVNSNAFWAASEFLYGEEVLDKMGRDAEKIAEHTASLAGLFGDASSAGTGLLTIMSASADEFGRIRDESGRTVASIKEVDGEYEWWINDVGSLAEQLGVTEDAVTSAMSALGVYSDVGTNDLNEVKESAEEVPEDVETKITVDAEQFDIEMERIQNELDALASTPIVVPVTTTNNGHAFGYGAGYGFGYASGTSSAPGGATLVNEAGPELISDNGVAYIANSGRPAIVNLSRGASVLTAHDTKSVLGNATSFSPIPAAALGIRTTNLTMTDTGGGNGYVKPATPKKNTTPISVVTTSSSSGGGSGSSGGGSSGTTVAAAATSGTSEDAIADALDTALKLLDEQAELADNEGRHGIEKEFYQQAYDRIQQSIDEYIANGYEETSLEIVQLKNQQYEYLEKATDAASHVWEELEDGLDKKLDNIDSQIELQDDPKFTQEMSQKAQGYVDELILKYLDAGYSETSDEVLALMLKKKSYQEAEQKAYETIWSNIADALDDELSNIDAKITLAENRGETNSVIALQNDAQDAIQNIIDRAIAMGYAQDSPEVVALKNKGYSYAQSQEGAISDLWDNLITAIENLTSSTDDANALAEKQLAVEDAKQAYENAISQRNVRIYNRRTGQWEWIANEKTVQSAYENMQKSEEELRKEELDREINAIKSGDISSLSSMTIGPALAAAISSASGGELSAFLNAYNALSGGASLSASTNGTSAFGQNSDSHDTIYSFPGGITLTAEQAENTTLAQLAKQLSVLGITS